MLSIRPFVPGLAVFLLCNVAAAGGDIIQVPLRWCAIDGSPAVVSPGGAGQPNTDTVLWRRHERASDRIWKPGADITFRSGMIMEIKDLASFPVIADPCPPAGTAVCQGGDGDGLACTPDGMGEDPAVCGESVACATESCACANCVGMLGDVVDPDIDGQERQLVEDACRAGWDDLENEFGQSLTGPIAVNIREFVSPAGFSSTLRGKAAGPALSADSTDPADICNTPPIDITGTQSSGWTVLVDNQIINDPDEEVAAHEFGHILWLRHGNGLDDDGDGRYDPDGLGLGFNCDPEESGVNDPATLMHPNGLNLTKTITTPQRLTAREVADTIANAAAAGSRRGGTVGLAVLGDDQRDAADDGALFEMTWASVLVNEPEDLTILAHGLAERSTLQVDHEFLFFLDTDDDPDTGASPNAIPGLLATPTCFPRADLVTRVTLPFGAAPPLTTVWTWDQGAGAFAPVVSADISAELYATTSFDGTPSDVFETVSLRIPTSLIGGLAEVVPGQAIAQLAGFPSFDGDLLAEELAGECSLPFRLTRADYPDCRLTPATALPGQSVEVEAAGLFADDQVEVLLGDLLIAEGSSDSQGGATVKFDVPIDSPAGPRLVTVGVLGTAVTADCTLHVEPLGGGLIEPALRGVVFDTGQFVHIDTATGAGVQMGTSVARNGLANRGAELFGIAVGEQLYRLDPADGAQLGSVLPQFGIGVEGAIAFRADGVGFAIRGAAGDPPQLWRFGTIDGGAVLVERDIGVRMDGLAFNSEHRLFGLGEDGLLYWIDTEIGFIEPIGPLGIPLNTTAGLAFGAADVLYAVVSDSLFTIDTGTGAATPVGPTGFGSILPDRGFSGLVSIPVAIDTDGDGVADLADNCLRAVNPRQRDTDGDGLGNLCDADLNNDCQTNFVDLEEFQRVFFTDDPDADLNSSGLVDFADLQRVRQLFFLPPGPGAAPNLCDP